MIEIDNIIKFLESLKQNVSDLDRKIELKVEDASGEGWNEGFDEGFTKGYLIAIEKGGKLDKEDFKYYLDKEKEKAINE